MTNPEANDTAPPRGAKIVFGAWLSGITLGLIVMIAIPLMGR